MSYDDSEWRALIERFDAGGAWRSLFVIGATDAGKTTLCRWLGRELAARHTTFAVDCDPGQSALGLPTTVALAREPWRGELPLAMRFIGSTSPSRNFMQTLDGVKRLADRAMELGAERLVVDCCGYFEAGGGREFHHNQVDLLRPDHLVALQRGGELEPWLTVFERRERPRLHRLRVSDAVVPRDTSRRTAYREEKLARYFAGALSQTLPTVGIGFHSMTPRLSSRESDAGLLVSLCDEDGFVVVLAILEELRGGTARLFAPPFDAARVASLQFGSVRLDRSGREQLGP